MAASATVLSLIYDLIKKSVSKKFESVGCKDKCPLRLARRPLDNGPCWRSKTTKTESNKLFYDPSPQNRDSIAAEGGGVCEQVCSGQWFRS